jgi:methyltransferase
MVAIHVLWLALPSVEVLLRGAVAPAWVWWPALGLLVLGQALRQWTLATLGRAWNARAVVPLDLRVVTAGPYRFVRHPNYLAVLFELVALPLAGGAWVSLVLLNLAHAPVLARRIRGEERLLAEVPGYREAMAGRGRLLPRLRAPERARRGA